MGIIYLIQPAELVGTNRYKIGCSAKNTLERILSYKKGTRVLSVNYSNDYSKIEKILIEEFNKKFKLIAGREYFEGNEKDIYKLFIEIVYENYIDFSIKPNHKYLADQILLLKSLMDQHEEEKRIMKKEMEEQKEKIKQLEENGLSNNNTDNSITTNSNNTTNNKY